MDWNLPFGFGLHWKEALFILGILVFIGFAFWQEQRARQARKQQLQDLIGGSFAEVRQDPALLKECPENIEKVGFVQYEDMVQRGRMRQLEQIYDSFLVTVQQNILDLEVDGDDPIVEDNARWLAKEWGIPFETRDEP